MTGSSPNRVTRRQALRRIAAAGAVAWAVPAVQTVNMTRAFAQTQASNAKVCTWFRISKSDLSPDGGIGACGGAITSSDTCLSQVGPTDCTPVLGVPSTPSGSMWTVCLGLGYQVQEVGLSDVNGHCWSSARAQANTNVGQPTMSDNGTGGWQGWASAGGCVTAAQSADASGTYVDIDHMDVMVCALPGALLSPSPSSTPSPSVSPTPSDTPSPSGAPSPPGTTGPSGTTGPAGFTPSPSTDGGSPTDTQTSSSSV